MVLVLVDCAPAYIPCHLPVLPAIHRRVKTAKETGDKVVVLEYRVRGTTYEVLSDELWGYDGSVTRVKLKWSGAREVIDACNEMGWDLSCIQLVGAETYCCVADTAGDLADELPASSIEVIREGCYDKVFGGGFPKRPNIRWV